MLRRNWGYLIAIVIVLALNAAMFLPNYRRPGPRQNLPETRLRALVMGLTIYAQNNRDCFPPPDHAASLLVQAGILPAELFEPPPSAPNEPAFFFFVVPATDGARWSNSFKATAPLVYANPAFYGGTKTQVGWTDGHTDLVTTTELDHLVRAAGVWVEPAK
jgi:hypothetical protein